MINGALKATAATAVLMLGLSGPTLALAANGTAAPLPPGAMPPAVTTTTTTTVAPTATLPGGPVSPDALPGSTGPLTSQPNTPRIVQDAMTGLNKTDPINMDDMIRAQDAINRLDLLLEIEKRQTELKKLRDERNKPSSGSMVGSIPASALNLPPMKVGTSSGSGMMLPSPGTGLSKPADSSSYSLKRIVGTEGRYSAVISAGGDKIISVHAGETLPDGSKVKTVTLTSVSLVKDKKSKTLTIPSDSYIVRGSDELIP